MKSVGDKFNSTFTRIEWSMPVERDFKKASWKQIRNTRGYNVIHQINNITYWSIEFESYKELS